MRKPTVQSITIPTNVDQAFIDIAAIIESFSWIEYGFGECETLRKNNKSFPAIHVDGTNKKEYYNLLPHDDLDGYSFIDVQDYDYEMNGVDILTTKIEFDIIVWFNYRSVFGDYENKTINHVRKLVYDKFKAERSKTTKYSLKINGDSKRFEDIFGKWDYLESNEQSMMRPYGALKINCEIIVQNGIC